MQIPHQNTSFFKFEPKCPGNDSLLTVREASERMPESPAQIRRLITSKWLRATNSNPKSKWCQIPESEIARYLTYKYPAWPEPRRDGHHLDEEYGF